ncbi:MAG: flagellar biosynthesis anti-sigma factor FlgM [Erythrobacter sp.]
MSSFELNKVQGVGAPRALSESDRAQLEARRGEAKSAPRNGAEKPGISVEISQSAAANAAPVDNERVSEIRQALKDGSYPLVPAKIADAMIAARVGLGIESEQSA